MQAAPTINPATASGTSAPHAEAASGASAYPSGMAPSESSQSYEVTRASAWAGTADWTAVSQTGLRKPSPAMAIPYATTDTATGVCAASRQSGSA